MKEILGIEQFQYSEAKVGDLVTGEVVAEAMNCLPPACMRQSCSQLGEAYSCWKDPHTHAWRPVYATFKCVVAGENSWDENAIWEYCGHCFLGEITERGINPAYEN